MDSWLGILEHLRTTAGITQSWTWSHVVNTSDLQWFSMVKHLTELNGFITLLSMRKMLIIKQSMTWKSWTLFRLVEIVVTSLVRMLNTNLNFATLCWAIQYELVRDHPYTWAIRPELCQWPPGFTLAYTLTCILFAVWLEIWLRLDLAPALP